MGDTIEKIAVEKAGIIKKNIPVVVGETQKEIHNVYKEKADNEKAELIYADKMFELVHFDSEKPESEYVKINLKNCSTDKIYELSSPLRGIYQKKNIITSFCALNKLKEKGFVISDDNIITGIRNVIKNTGLKGRWQILSKVPLTICDTGHNVAGISEVVKQIGMMKYNKLHFVLGMVNDKDVSGILDLLPKEAIYYFCRPDIPRGHNANELCDKALKFNLKGNVFDSVRDALNAARHNANSNDMIFIGGSTFVVAEVV